MMENQKEEICQEKAYDDAKKKRKQRSLVYQQAEQGGIDSEAR